MLASCVAVAGCSGGAADAKEKSPQELIDEWAAIACVGAPDLRTNPGEGDALISAACTLPEESLAMSQRRQYFEVLASSTAVKTRIASVDCSTETLRVVGPNWYSPTLIQEIATALQDKMGGTLGC